MLRITLNDLADVAVSLRLDGKLAGTCVSAFEEQWSNIKEIGYKTILFDFSGVSYIDAEGVRMLERIKDERVRIVNCPLFIETLLGDLLLNKQDERKL